jgi:hypothetical protein
VGVTVAVLAALDGHATAVFVSIGCLLALLLFGVLLLVAYGVICHRSAERIRHRATEPGELARAGVAQSAKRVRRGLRHNLFVHDCH